MYFNAPSPRLKTANPNVSRVRGVHWQGFRGTAVQVLPQAPDNAANGHLGLARRVKIFLRFWKTAQVTKCHLNTRPQTGHISLNIDIKFIVQEKFHEIFGQERAGVPTPGNCLINLKMGCESRLKTWGLKRLNREGARDAKKIKVKTNLDTDEHGLHGCSGCRHLKTNSTNRTNQTN